MKLIKVSAFLLSFSISVVAHAIAPVVDAYNDSDNEIRVPSSSSKTTPHVSTDDISSFSQGQRVAIVERQIANLNPLLVQTDDLNQQVQELRGRLDEQNHRLRRLEEQVRSQYQDLEKRLKQKPLLPSSIAVPSSSSITINPHPSSVQNTATAARSISSSQLPLASGERDYQNAFQLLKMKQYGPAVEGFESFIKKYPFDVNRPNAIYFLGQLYLLQGQPEQSITRFNDFVEKYPQDGRVPDALLQLGLAYFAKGNKTTAMEIFEKIIKKYPDSKAAESAKARLQQFQAMISAANMASNKA